MDEMNQGKTLQGVKIAALNRQEVLIISKGGMKEIPLREEDRLKLADKPLAEMTSTELLDRYYELVEKARDVEDEIRNVKQAIEDLKNT
jgi:hypothetical protein